MGSYKWMQSVFVIFIFISGSSPFQDFEEKQDVQIVDRKLGAGTPSEKNFIVRDEKENYDDYNEYSDDTRNDDDDDDDDTFDLYEDEDQIVNVRSNRRKSRKDSFVTGRVYVPLSYRQRNRRNRRRRSGWSAFSWWGGDLGRRRNKN